LTESATQIITNASGLLLAIGGFVFAYIKVAGRLERKKIKNSLPEETRINGWLEQFISKFPYPAWIKLVVPCDKGKIEFRMQFVNGKYEEWFGIRNCDYVGKTDFEVWSKETAKEYYAGDAAVYASKGSLCVSEHVENLRESLYSIYPDKKLTFRKFYVEKDGVCGIVGILEQRIPKDIGKLFHD